MKPSYNWDFFISHAGPDLELARSLYKQLAPPAEVFLDDEKLILGKPWPESLEQALHESLISVILITPNTDTAHYQREEITIAIQRTRSDPHTHRIIPVFASKSPNAPVKIPIGLNTIHGIRVKGKADFKSAGKKLAQSLKLMKTQENRKATLVPVMQRAVGNITNPQKATDVVSGLLGATTLVRPLFITVLMAFIASVLMLFVCMIIPTNDRSLLLFADGALCLLLLAALFVLISRSLDYVPKIAYENFNAA